MNSIYLGLFIGILVAGVIVLLVYFAKRNEIFKIVLLSFLCASYLGLTTYCVIQLNIYYSAQGGIFGRLSEVISPSVNIDDSLKFEFKNVCLTQDLGTETYSLRLYCDDKVSLDSSKKYGLYVNDNPINMTVSTSNLLFGDYRYLFYSENNQLLLDDTLHIRFVFNNNNSYLIVSTDSGSLGSKLWNYYFRNNNFVVSLKENSYITGSTLSFGTGIVPQFYEVRYVYADNYSRVEYVPENSNLNIDNFIGVENWTIDDVVVDNSYIVSSDIIVQANFYSDGLNNVSGLHYRMCDTGIMYSSDDYAGLVYRDFDSNQIFVVTNSGYGWNLRYVTDYNLYYATSSYQEFNDIVFDVDTFVSYSLPFKTNHYYIYKDNLILKMVYDERNVQGLNSYNLKTNTSNVLVEYGSWSSLEGFSTYNSTVNIAYNLDNYSTSARFNFKNESFTIDAGLNGIDSKYGVYLSDNVLKVAFIDSNGRIKVYDVKTKTTQTINSSYVWENVWGYSPNDPEIGFIRNQNGSVCYLLIYNFESGAVSYDQFNNGTVIAH